MLRGFDYDIQSLVRQGLEEKGIKILVNTVRDGVTKCSKTLTVALSDNRQLAVNEIICATGRKPNIENLGLEKLGVDLEKGAVLVDSNLQRANLWDVDLQIAFLQRVNFQRAYLQGAKLMGADLRSTSFQGADLRGANLENANLQGANFDGANLEKAQLTGALMLGAKLCNTVMPDGHVEYSGCILTGQ